MFLLPSEPFLLVKDLQALQLSFTRRHIHEHLAWLLHFQAQCIFEFEYRRRSWNKIAHILADILHNGSAEIRTDKDELVSIMTINAQGEGIFPDLEVLQLNATGPLALRSGNAETTSENASICHCALNHVMWKCRFNQSAEAYRVVGSTERMEGCAFLF